MINTNIFQQGVFIGLEEKVLLGHWSELKNIQHRPKTTPRPHADLIKQWADDEDCVVEVKINNKWLVASEPSWLDIYQYRIKPKQSSAKTELMDEIAKMEQALAELKAKADQVE